VTFVFDSSLSSVVEVDVNRADAVRPGPEPGPLSPELLDRMNRYWQAANYLTVGQIYLADNPLLRQPLTPEHIKPRLLGHWGTSPGLSMIYVHLNRIIVERDAELLLLTGPGHGGPAIVANTYLEGTYSEVYPSVGLSVEGIAHLFRQFSTPGGVPSHVGATTPGSIHEGGELGYVLAHAFGAAFDNPNLTVVAVVGDGESETGPLAGSWRSTSFLNPARDGAVLPILHLNGYKISGPSILARETDADIEKFLEGCGYSPRFVAGSDPELIHQALARELDSAFDDIREIQSAWRENGVQKRPAWPVIVMRTPKGWTGPKMLDGLPVEGTFRSHQVPLPQPRTDAEQLRGLDAWLRSYRPEDLFDDDGRLRSDLAELAPRGTRRLGSSPHANGGRLTQPLDLPDFRTYAVAVDVPGTSVQESTGRLGEMLRDTYSNSAKAANFRVFCPDETNSNRLSPVFEVDDRCLVGTLLPIDDHVAQDGRLMEVLSEHLCEGWLEGYTLTGRHGLFATYEAFAMVSASMAVQHTKWLEESASIPWREPVPSLNILLTSTCWRNDHNGFSHQGPGLIDVMLSKNGEVTRVYFPPDANCLLSMADHCFRSRGYVNLIVIDKQPQLQFLSMDDAIAHCSTGGSVWEWAGTAGDARPDVVLACAGDTPTLESLAAAEWLRRSVPDLSLRFVNVVDITTLFPPDVHPHGMDATRFHTLFDSEAPVVFAFHGYQRAVHELVHGRPNADRFHVRGYNERGSTTTPFDMVSLNGMSRYHLAMECLRRSERHRDRSAELIAECESLIVRAAAYARDHMQDPPEIANWRWPSSRP
jgi:xylulose-5-phosphate/fructose-6-phosphate phosphoketolase